MKGILVPLDGSEAAEAVFDTLQPLIPASGGRVSLITVLHQPYPMATTYIPHAVTEESLMRERNEQPRSYLEACASA